jgi:hypothetical protein
MKKKGKIVKIFEDYGAFFESYELCTIKWDALGESVKCKSSKSIHKPKVLENRIYPGFRPNS